MTENLGTAALHITVDTSKFEAGVTKARRSTKDLAAAAQQAQTAINEGSRRSIASLERQIGTLGKSTEEAIRWRIAQQTAGRTAERLTADLDRQVAILNAVALAQGRMGISTRQQAAALRGLPAQITDIFTSLQGGQRPLTVLLQQGGQLKDMFGGIVPASKALGTSLLGMVNPATLAAAAAVALGVAWKQGSDEAVAFNRALIETGGFAERTSSDLQGLAQNLDNINGVTEHSASATIAAVAATGRFAGDQLEQVSRAAAAWSAATGESVDSIVAKFVKIADDPVKAILELNRSQHFLTEATLHQAESMEEQGRQIDAARILIDAYSDTLLDRAPKITENLGYIEAMWRRIKKESAEAWDEMLSVGRAPSTDDLSKRIQMWQADLARQGANVPAAIINARQAQIREAQRQMVGLAFDSNQARIRGTNGIVDTNQHNDQKKAQEEWNRLQLSNLTKRERLESEITDIEEKGLAAGKTRAEIETAIANARARYKESISKEARSGSKSDPTDGIVSRLREQIALNQEQAKSEDKLTTTERMLIEVRTKLDQLGSKASPARRKEIQELLGVAKASGEAAEAAMEELKAKERLTQLREQLSNTELNQRRSVTADLMELGRGNNAVQELRRQLDIHRWYEDEVTKLNRQAAREKRKVTAEEEAELKASYERQLQFERQYQQDRIRMMGEWMVGARRAWENYLDASKDVAGQVEEIWGEAFGTLEDIAVDGLSGNLKSWNDYFESLHQMILRFIVRQQFSKAMEKLASSNGKVGSFLGGLLGKGEGSGDSAAGLTSAAGALSASAGPLLGAASALSASAAALAAAGTAAAGGSALGSSGGSNFLSSLFSSFGSGSSGGGWGAFAPNQPGFAKGSAFSRNGIVDTPTLFPFAKGIGLMGEDGPEAIMPLKRLPGGRLGVAADVRGTDSGSRLIRPVLNQQFVVQGRLDRTTREQLARDSGREAQRGMVRTGR